MDSMLRHSIKSKFDGVKQKEQAGISSSHWNEERGMERDTRNVDHGTRNGEEYEERGTRTWIEERGTRNGEEYRAWNKNVDRGTWNKEL